MLPAAPVCRFLLMVLSISLASCNRNPPPSPTEASHVHDHAPKNGGVLVELGEEEFHVEFARGTTPGVLTAYVMDAHVENYVRIEAPSFEATAQISSETFPLTFSAVASGETGETVGNTSLFEAHAPGLSSSGTIKINVPTLTVKGRTYTGISVELPAQPKP